MTHMKHEITLASVQCSFSNDRQANIEKVSELIHNAASHGAQLIVTPELLEGPYFCREERDKFFAWARPFQDHPTISHFKKLAKQLQVALPVSFFEKDGPCYYNSVAMIDADGSTLGLYRKSHIPDGPGYEEKYYFRPGNTGFKVWKTLYGTVGVGICWDQWFPECARAMVLKGAEVLLYPTAIGSEPENPELNTKDLWQRAMIGHAVSNVVPILASNRIGIEGGQRFYGHSFIANHRGDLIAELPSEQEGMIYSTIDLEMVRMNRASFGFFRDRRPELYGDLVPGRNELS